MWKQVFAKHDRSGFSLVELMITVGITGVLSMGMGTMMRDQHVGSKHREARFEMMAVTFDLFEVLQDDANCNATLAGLNMGGIGAQIPTIFKVASGGINATKFQINDIFGGRETGNANPVAGQVQLTDMRVNNFRALGKSANEGLATVTLTFQTGAQNVGANTFTKSIDLQVLQDGTGDIVNCQGDNAQMTQAFCDLFNGTLVGGTNCQEIAIDSSGINPAITSNGNVQVSAGATTTVDGTLSGASFNLQETTVAGLISSSGNIIGDGDLTVVGGGNLTGNTRVEALEYCIAGECKQVWFDNVGCAANEVLQAIQHNGVGYRATCASSSFSKSCGGFSGPVTTFGIGGSHAAEMNASPGGYSVAACNMSWPIVNRDFP